MDSGAKMVKDKLNIVDVVGSYVELRRAGRNYTARCPFHKERTASFMVSPERGTYMCFGCGEKGDIFTFVEKMDGVDFSTALKQLAERAGVKLPKFAARAPEEKEKEERLRDVCEAATTYFESQYQKRTDVQEYVRKRGVKDETVATWRIGYAPASWEELSKHLLGLGFSKDEIVDAGLAAKSERRAGEIYDRFRGRIMFPIFDMASHPIAFSGRHFEAMIGASDEKEPAKYVNSPETLLFKKSRVLYGLHAAKETIRKADCILLVEGQFDVVLSHQTGLRFACAVSGTALTDEHLSLLSRLSKRLILALDADEAGIRAGLKSAAMALAMGFDVKVPKIVGGKDPADLAAQDPELLRKAIRESLPAVEFFLDALRPQAKDERAYKKLVEEQVLPLVAAIPSKIDQAHFVRVVANRIDVPEDAVRAEVAKKSTRPMGAQTTASAPAAPQSGLSPLEKAAGMLIARFDPESSQLERLRRLLGNRFEEVRAAAAPEEERLRFEFDALIGEEGEVAETLFQTLERMQLDERIADTRRALKAAEASRDASATASLTQELMALTRKKQGVHSIVAKKGK